jgi:hypothetical protein
VSAGFRLGLLLLLLCGCSMVPPSDGMGSPQSPSVTPTFPATITPPLNGENLDAPTLNVNVETPLQNGVEAARLLLYGGGLRLVVSGDSGTSMTIQPMRGIMTGLVPGGPVVQALGMLDPVTINPKSLAGGAFTANARYWVYARLSGNPATLSWVVTTNGPDASLSYMSGDLSAQYVTTFYTLSTSAILRYTQNGNYYSYAQRIGTGSGASGNLALDTTSTVGPATINWGPSAPVQANIAKLQVLFIGGAGPCDLQLASSGESPGAEAALIATYKTTLNLDCVAVGGAQTFDYVLSANTGSIAVWIAGFWL